MSLAAHREALKMTQADVASRIALLGGPDVTDSAISRYETGSRGIPSRLVPYLASVLGVDAEDIFYELDDPASEVEGDGDATPLPVAVAS